MMGKVAGADKMVKLVEVIRRAHLEQMQALVAAIVKVAYLLEQRLVECNARLFAHFPSCRLQRGLSRIPHPLGNVPVAGSGYMA
jgi:hypothetical protein